MQFLSLSAAITLTDISERTFWRKFADGSIDRVKVNGKVMIPFDSIKTHFCLPLQPEELAVLESADAGDAEAQNEMALIFLANNKPKNAMYWLELSARQNYADATNLLGQCYMGVNGVVKDENTGMMWLAKAAALGHAISLLQMQSMRDKCATH
ncbi:MAG: sel1 repeat family protein [Deltaproteobacteria bacterium]|nr:sel1 repeat family protein [Deltaproteobacteria bacterium]